MGKGTTKKTKESAVQKKATAEKLDTASLPELTIDRDNGCIIAKFDDGRDPVTVELNGAQFAAAVLKISNEISCCESKAQEKALHEELEEKVRSCKKELKNSKMDYRTDPLKGSLKRCLDGIINSLKKKEEKESYPLRCVVENLCSFLRLYKDKVADLATELGKLLKDLQDFLEKNKNRIETHYDMKELGEELRRLYKLPVDQNRKWLNKFKESKYFKESKKNENRDYGRVVSNLLSEARITIETELKKNGINLSVETFLPMGPKRMKYPRKKIQFQGHDPFFEVAKGVFAIKGASEIVLSEARKEIKFIPHDFKGELNIPEGVRRIRGEVFRNCDKITSIRIPKSVTVIEADIEEYIFFECSALEQLEVAEENSKYKSINGMLFNKKGTELICVPQGIKEGVQIPVSVTRIGYSAFADCTRLKSIVIPESVTEIEVWAFSGCTGLTSITIPKSVTKIDYQIFIGCTGLERIEVAEENPKYKSINGIVFNKAGTELICVPGGIKGNVQIPQGITRIDDSVFQNCIFRSITIPKSMKYISCYDFDGCTSLKEIYFDGVEEDASELKKFFEDAWKDLQVTVYCRNGTKGWGKIFGGLTTKEIEAKD